MEGVFLLVGEMDWGVGDLVFICVLDGHTVFFFFLECGSGRWRGYVDVLGVSFEPPLVM